MCSITVVPRNDGFRCLFNRDERVSRTAAFPPQHHEVGSTSGVFPLDPDGGGTWVGCNDAGLLLALLNRSASLPAGPAGPAGLAEPTGAELRSRGVLIPELLRYRSVSDVCQAASGLLSPRFAPLRLIAVQAGVVGVVTWDGLSSATESIAMNQPLLFTSSSLGDAIVETPRRRLFDATLINAADSWLAGQQRYHRHQWPDRPDVSVCMERAGRRTVSRSTIDVAATTVTFAYEPLGAGGVATSPPCLVALPRGVPDNAG